MSMMKRAHVTEAERETPIIAHYDVVVVGGGVAGAAAAIAAARTGASTCVLERETCLGGLATLGLIVVYLPLCDGVGNQVVGGLGEELLKNSIKYGPGEIPKCWLPGGDLGERKKRRYQLEYNAASFIISMEELLLDSGAEPIYDCRCCDVVKEDDKITAVIVETKSGRGAITCGAVVDASGDADVCHRAGEETVTYEKNVKTGWFLSYDGRDVKRHELTDNFYDITPDTPTFSGVDWRDVTKMSIEGRRMIMNYVKAVNGEAGDARAVVVTPSIHGATVTERENDSGRLIYPLLIPTCPGFRMTRRLKGTLELDDSHDGVHFDDVVGMIGDWRKRGPVYGIPLSSLIGTRNANLITAGRCVSTTTSTWDVTRVIPACAVTGQAAGVAASLVGTGKHASFMDMDVVRCQEILRSQNVLLNESVIKKRPPVPDGFSTIFVNSRIV